MELCFAAVKDVERPRILDVGVGSGYLLACFGRLAQARNGHMFGIELLPGLAQFARKNLQSGDGDLLDSGVVSLTCANGWDGLPNKAPFHFIHVGAAAEKVPRALMDQLADGGQLVVPVNEPRGGQMLVEITRNGNEFTQRKLMAVWYVPLVRGRKMSV
jgi:protein-L-isoaspartate(D-aspartate) O-methyltransferase